MKNKNLTHSIIISVLFLIVIISLLFSLILCYSCRQVSIEEKWVWIYESGSFPPQNQDNCSRMLEYPCDKSLFILNLFVLLLISYFFVRIVFKLKERISDYFYQRGKGKGNEKK